MKLYAEKYVQLDFGELQPAFSLAINGLLDANRDGDEYAMAELMTFYTRMRAKLNIESVIGLVALPETDETVLAVFPVIGEGKVFVLQYDAEVDRHFIFLEDAWTHKFSRESLQLSVKHSKELTNVLY